jgi:hypothetical protein
MHGVYVLCNKKKHMCVIGMSVSMEKYDTEGLMKRMICEECDGIRCTAVGQEIARMEMLKNREED